MIVLVVLGNRSHLKRLGSVGLVGIYSARVKSYSSRSYDIHKFIKYKFINVGVIIKRDRIAFKRKKRYIHI